MTSNTTPLRAFLIAILAVPFCAAPSARAQTVVGEVFASDASVHGSVVLAAGGTRVVSGSTVAAGAGAAALKLERGGEVRICPGTKLSVSASSTGRELTLSFSTGAVELHYPLASSADSLQTPDFRLLLAGPGSFHLAISGDARGNTCVRTLPSNTASVIVSELMGDGTYQVKADEQVVFRRGHIADISRDLPPDCGCPPAPPAVNRASSPADAIPPANVATRITPPSPAQPAATPTADLAAALAPQPTANPTRDPTAAGTGAVPPSPPGQVHVEVEAPFVFRADDPGPPPRIIAQVRLSDRAKALAFDPAVFPPSAEALSKTASAPSPDTEAATKPPPRKGFLGRLRSLVAALFK